MSLESLPSNISEHLSQINSQTNVNELIQTSSCDQDVECNLPLSIKPEKYFTQKTVKSNNKGADVKRQTFFRKKSELFLSDNEISDTLVPPKVHAPHHSIQKNFHFIQNPGDQDTQNHLVDQKEHNYDYHNFLLNRMDHLSIDLPLHSSIESEETIAEPVRMVQTQKNAVIKREIEKSHQRTMSYKDNFNRSKERKLQVFKAKGSPHSEHIFIDNPYIEIDLSSQANNNYQPCGDRAENLPTFATYSSVEEEYTLKTSYDSFPLSNVYAKENKIPSAKKSIQAQASESNLNSLDQSDKENKNFNLNTKHKTLQNSKKIGKTIKSQQPHYLNPKTARKKKNQEEQSFQTPCLEKGQSLIQTDEKLKPVTPAKEINNPKQVTIDFSHPSPFSPINVMSDKIEVSPKTIPLMNVKDCPKIYGPQAKRPESDCVIENACILGNIIQSNKAMMDYPKVTIKLSDNNDDAASLAVAAQTQSAKNSQKIRDLLTKRNEHILRKIIGKANIDYPFPVYNHQHPHHNLSVEFVENISQPKEAQLKGETINVSHLSERCISEPNGFYIKKGGAEVESDYITKSFDDHRCVEPKSKSFIKIENNIQPQLLRRNQSDPKLRQPTTTSTKPTAATKKNTVRTLSLDISKFKNINIEKQLSELPNHPIIKRTSISKIPHKQLEKSFEKNRTSNILPDKRLSIKKENNPLAQNLNRITKQFQTYTIIDVPKPKKDLNNQSQQQINVGSRRESCNMVQDKYKNKSSISFKPPTKHKRSATIDEFNKSFR